MREECVYIYTHIYIYIYIHLQPNPFEETLEVSPKLRLKAEQFLFSKSYLVVGKNSRVEIRFSQSYLAVQHTSRLKRCHDEMRLAKKKLL